MPDIQTYGVKPSMAVLSGIFFVGGVICLGMLMRYPLTGEPFIVYPNGEGPRGANGLELAAYSLPALVFIVFGGIGLLAFQNQKIFIERGGLSSNNILGRQGFRARWDQLTRLHRRSGRSGHYYVLDAGKKSMTISSGMERIEEIAEVIRARAPHLQDEEAATISVG